MKKTFLIVFLFFVFLGCSSKQLSSQSATIIFKTKEFKFYDKGFISQYEDKVNLSIYSFGQIVLNLDVYEDRVCQKDSYLQCMSGADFNNKYLNTSYNDDFLYTLLQKDIINYKDKDNGIRIKIIKNKNGN